MVGAGGREGGGGVDSPRVETGTEHRDSRALGRQMAAAQQEITLQNRVHTERDGLVRRVCPRHRAACAAVAARIALSVGAARARRHSCGEDKLAAFEELQVGTAAEVSRIAWRKVACVCVCKGGERGL